MMVKRIGMRRVIMLAVFATVNFLIAATYFVVVMPAQETAQNQLNAINGEISDISTRLQNIKSDMAAFQGNYDRYKVLDKSGFFSNQDRFGAARALDSLRASADLLGFTYNINPVETIPNADADASNASLYKSQIKIENISSVFDMNIYRFIQMLNTLSLQHMRVESFEIKRARPLTKEVLEQLSKEKIELVNSSLVADWYTMVPKVSPTSAGSGQAPYNPNEFRGR